MPERLTVFVSSKMAELAPERAAVREALDALAVHAWLFERDGGARPESPQKVFLTEVEQADLYLGLFWLGHGDYTIEEFEHARSVGKDCLVYEKRVGVEKRSSELARFLSGIGAVESGVTIKWFETAAQLGRYVKEDVAAWQTRIVREWMRRVRRGAWNLTRPRNPNFVGRAAQLAALRDALKSRRLVAVHGMPGVGKTQLAAEYAYRWTSDYDVVWWVRGETPAVAAVDLAALATGLDLPEASGRDPSEQLEAAQRWLSRNERWLLVIDNAWSREQVNEFLPGGAGHVVITSRNPNWRGTADDLPLGALTRDESVALLAAWSEQSDEAAAGRVAELVGDLPLALSQAGAYVHETQMQLSAYAELLATRRVELWAKERRSDDYPDTVAKTFSLAIELLREASQPAAQLLTLSSFLAPDEIPRDVITGQAERFPEPLQTAAAEPLEAAEAFSWLRRYSLADVGLEMFSVHRLVQATVRDVLPQREQRRWVSAAIRMMADALGFQDDDPATWEPSGRLLPHALAAADHAAQRGLEPEMTASLLNDAGMLLKRQARFKEAQAELERAITINEVTYGADHPEVATSVNNLGEVLFDLGELEEARAAIERALSIDEAFHGPNHPDVARDVHNLGVVLRHLGQFRQARVACERALSIDEATYGPDDPEVAFDVSNLGLVLQDLGDYGEARESFERALSIDEATYGPDHPHLARDLNNLGLALRNLGELGEARTTLERAVRIDEATHGPDHPEVATDVNNLGLVLQDLGEYGEARESFERALSIDEATYGPDHPNVARDVNGLGLALLQLGELGEARASFERALSIDEATYGPNHPNVARDVGNVALVLRDLGELAEARAAFERALAIVGGSLGANDAQAKLLRDNLRSLDADPRGFKAR